VPFLSLEAVLIRSLADSIILEMTIIAPQKKNRACSTYAIFGYTPSHHLHGKKNRGVSRPQRRMATRCIFGNSAVSYEILTLLI
jgi:hypothetical protein